MTTRIQTLINATALTATATLAVLAGSPSAMAQVPNCRGGSIDLSRFPAAEQNMRDFHVNVNGFAVESIKVWRVNADGTETLINWPNQDNNGGSNRVSVASDTDEANNQKIKWQVCSSGNFNRGNTIQVHVTQDGNINFDGWGRNIDGSLNCSFTPEIDETGTMLFCSNGSDGEDQLLNLQVFVTPDPIVFELPLQEALQIADPLPLDLINPHFLDHGVVLPGDQIPVFNLPLPPDPNMIFIVVYDSLVVDPCTGEEILTQELFEMTMPNAPAAPCPGDTNGDGVVDLQDLNEVLANFGTPC